MILPIFALFLLLLSLSGIGGCDGGSSSETVSFEPGQIEVFSEPSAIKGRTDAGNWVALYATDYLPHRDSGFADTSRADAQGRFVFTRMPVGAYHILVRGHHDSLAALLTGIDWPGNGVNPKHARMQSMATLSGFFSDSGVVSEGVVYIPGSPYYARADSLKHYFLESVPAGEYPIRKFWLRTLPCTGMCTVAEIRQDSTRLRLMPGEAAQW